MKYPKVSILIATYNQEQYISDAVLSALSLNYPNLEVIVSDDCSKDRTFDVLSDIKDNRLKVYRNEKNIGRIANHRKLVYEYATGEYVAFLDGDDFYVDKNFLLVAMDLFSKDKNIVSVIGGYKDLFFSGEEKIFAISNKINVVSGLDIFFRKVKVRYAHGSWIFKRNLIKNIEFFSGRVPIGDDLEGWFKSLLHGKVGIIPNIIFAHRIHFENGVVKVNADILLEDLKLYDIVAEYAINLGFEREMIKKWKNYSILRQFQSFISWANSLYKRGIYSKEMLDKLLIELSQGFKNIYGFPMITSKNKKFLTFQVKILQSFYRF